MEFTELNLDPKILEGTRKAGFTTCTQVQEETFRKTLTGKDVLVQSQTGTGKTAAFLISIFHLLLTDEKLKDGQALIIAPTRELADQIEKEAQLLGTFLPFRIQSFYGGVGYVQQEKALRDGVDIIIGTPGRLIDFNESGKLPFDNVKMLVIDEADRLFDMGFLPDLKRMLRRMPKREDRMTMLFSATLGSRVSHLAWEYMNEPAEIAIAPERMTVNEITQELYHVTKSQRTKVLLGILKREAPESVIIFTNTKHEAEEISQRLELNGYQSRFIIGDLPQKKRLAIIESIKAGKLRVLVATDVAARGLHIQDLQLVVNYDLPEDSENYVHRIGRTARAGKTGKAISLACENCVYNLEGIEKLIGKKIPASSPPPEMYAEDSSVGAGILHHRNPRDPGQRVTGRRPYGKSAERPARSYSGPGKPDTRRPRTDHPEPAGERKPYPHGRSERKDERVTPRPQHGAPRGNRPAEERKMPQPETGKSPEKKPVGSSVPGKTPRTQPPKQEQQKKPARAAAGDRQDRSKGTLSSGERLDYYREKYGESFKPVPGKPAQGKPAQRNPVPPREEKAQSEPKKKGILNRIIGLFKGEPKE